MVDVLLAAGVLQLASASLLGWPIALGRTSPQALKRAGIVAPRRLLQLHIDQVLMGLILLAVASAFPQLPTGIGVPLIIGTTVNPLLFLPLAFRPAWEQTLAYRAASVASFLATSGSLVALAVWVLSGGAS